MIKWSKRVMIPRIQGISRWIVFGAVLLCCTACDRIKEPVYHGQPLREWAMMTQDQDFDFSASADALEAAKAIRAIGPSAAVPWLVKWVKPRTMDSRLPGGAVESFRILGAEAKAAIPELAAFLRKPPVTMDERSCWISAADAISYLGPDAIPVMIELADSVQDGKEQLIENLGNMGTNGGLAVPRLVTWAQDSESTVRGAALSALGRIALQPKTVVPVVRKALHDPEPRVRSMAVESLAGFGSEARDAIPDLAAILKSAAAGSSEWENVPEALSYLGPEAIPAIIQLAETAQEQKVRLVESLGNLGTNGTQAIPRLIAWTHDPSPDIRRAAASALGGIALQPETVVPILRNLLRDPDPGVKSAAAGAFAGFGPAARSAVWDLMRMLDALDFKGQAIVIESLGRIGGAGEERKVVLPWLIKKLHFHPATLEPGWGLVYTAAASALGDMGGREAYDALMECASKGNKWKRTAVYKALEKIDPQTFESRAE